MCQYPRLKSGHGGAYFLHALTDPKQMDGFYGTKVIKFDSSLTLNRNG